MHGRLLGAKIQRVLLGLSDARLLLLRQTLCSSIGGFVGCQLPHNLTAEGDWPNQAVYMRDLLAAVVAPDTCLNTSQAAETIAFLNAVRLPVLYNQSFVHLFLLAAFRSKLLEYSCNLRLSRSLNHFR